MNLDVVVATFQRPRMLARALESLLSAPIPDALSVHVTVVHKGLNDGTNDVLDAFVRQHPGRISTLREPEGGKSRALNTAIAATSGDLVGIIDDDEEIDPNWFTAVAEGFADPAVDFIGGPCLPRWGAVPPPWLPSSWQGVIGFVDDGDRVMVFGKDAPGILMGGNAVLRRAVLERVGGYAPALGPTPTRRLLSGEDEDLYRRLLAAGAHGLYLPALKIYHYIPPQRLTKRYYRRWSFWNGVSGSVIDAVRPLAAKRIGRVPRYLFGTAGRAALMAIRAARRDPAKRFAGELALWRLAGFVYGCYVYQKQQQVR
jgi:glucosyl-dolichyl phosphate glucuronosyltransferase